LVDHPDQVEVHRLKGTTRFSNEGGQGDLGKIIGKQGRTARAIEPFSVQLPQNETFRVESSVISIHGVVSLNRSDY
jgi:predicted RNA-binding protein YlqC (UPF0109 family)